MPPRKKSQPKPVKATSAYKSTPLEDEFEEKLIQAKVPQWQREYRFHDKRRWRLDFAWPDLKIAIEVHGGTFGFQKYGKWVAAGGHTTGVGFRQDREKMNAAMALGWRVFEIDSSHVHGRYGIKLAKDVLL